MNVRGEVNFVSHGDSLDAVGLSYEHPSGKAEEPKKNWLDQQAVTITEELQDRGSERRHRQLLSICEQHDLSDLPQQALLATRARLAKEQRRGPVERPGAYYASVLIKLLEQHQVFVPTAGEDDAEEVRRLARLSLGLEG